MSFRLITAAFILSSTLTGVTSVAKTKNKKAAPSFTQEIYAALQGKNTAHDLCTSIPSCVVEEKKNQEIFKNTALNLGKKNANSFELKINKETYMVRVNETQRRVSSIGSLEIPRIKTFMTFEDWKEALEKKRDSKSSAVIQIMIPEAEAAVPLLIGLVVGGFLLDDLTSLANCTLRTPVQVREQAQRTNSLGGLFSGPVAENVETSLTSCLNRSYLSFFASGDMRREQDRFLLTDIQCSMSTPQGNKINRITFRTGNGASEQFDVEQEATPRIMTSTLTSRSSLINSTQRTAQEVYIERGYRHWLAKSPEGTNLEIPYNNERFPLIERVAEISRQCEKYAQEAERSMIIARRVLNLPTPARTATSGQEASR